MNYHSSIVLILSIIMASVLSIAATALEGPDPQVNATNGTISFAVLSDLHIGSNETNNTYKMFHYGDKILSDMIGDINSRKDIKFVLVVGDLTKDSEPCNHERAIELLNNLKMPYYITVGNHDLLKNGLPAANWGAAEVIKNYHMPWYNNSSLWYSVDPAPGLHLVSLDSASDRAHIGDWGGAISPEQVQWLDQDLAKNAGKKVIVMTHHALNHHAGVDDKLYYVDNADQVKKVLDKHGAHLAITGHIHITDIAKNGSLIERSTPATCSYPCAYTLIELTGSEAKVTTIWYGNSTIMDIAKQEFIKADKNVTQAEGLPSSRDAVISL